LGELNCIALHLVGSHHLLTPILDYFIFDHFFEEDFIFDHTNTYLKFC